MAAMTTSLQSHWTCAAKAGLACPASLSCRPRHPQTATAAQSSSRGQTWTGCKGACTSRKPLVCRAVAAAEPAQKELDVTKMEPLGDRLLIKTQQEAQKTSGGLFLSSGATKAIQEALIGEVLAVGEDVKIEVKTGSKVIFSKYASSDVKVPGGDVSFVSQKSVLATLS